MMGPAAIVTRRACRVVRHAVRRYSGGTLAKVTKNIRMRHFSLIAAKLAVLPTPLAEGIRLNPNRDGGTVPTYQTPAAAALHTDKSPPTPKR